MRKDGSDGRVTRGDGSRRDRAVRDAVRPRKMVLVLVW